MIHRWLAVLILLVFVLGAGSMWNPVFGQDAMSVQVRSSNVREKASALSKVLGKLAYGSRVSIVGKPGKSWIQVKSQQKTPLAGFMRTSALTKKKLKMKGTGASAAMAKADDVALAGKGFDKEIEDAYRKKNVNLTSAFAFLDKLEDDPKFKVKPEQVVEFVKKGKLKPKEVS